MKIYYNYSKWLRMNKMKFVKIVRRVQAARVVIRGWVYQEHRFLDLPRARLSTNQGNKYKDENRRNFWKTSK